MMPTNLYGFQNLMIPGRILFVNKYPDIEHLANLIYMTLVVLIISSRHVIVFKFLNTKKL